MSKAAPDRSDSLPPVIAVDGPSGTGKGTLCEKLARHLGWHLLDSGAIYRVLAFAALSRGLDAADEVSLADAALHLNLAFESSGGAGVRVLLDDRDVTEQIRSETAGNAASRVAAIPAVRTALLERQRAFRQPPGLVADGRDMGTVVFPDATLKVFLTASAEERAMRRYKQLKGKESGVSLPALLKDIAERDQRDRDRPVSPLVPATDAHVIDTTQMDAETVLMEVLALLRGRGVFVRS